MAQSRQAHVGHHVVHHVGHPLRVTIHSCSPFRCTLPPCPHVGVGPYTSAAIGSIAFNDAAAVVDGNVVGGMAVFLYERSTTRVAQGGLREGRQRGRRSGGAVWSRETWWTATECVF